MSRITHRLSCGVLAVLILALAFPPIAPDAQAGTKKSVKLVQFTSQGHVIGFDEDRVFVASSRHMLKVDFLNSNSVTPRVEGDTETDKVQPLGRVTYQNAWDGVTVVYEANGSTIAKSTYYLDKDNHVERIRLGYNRPIQIDEQGNLVIGFENGTLTESAPIAWQEINGKRNPVEVAYAMNGEREIGFSLGEYVEGIPVVIDPDLSWNTFLGGTGSGDSSNGISVDASGNVYVSGSAGATWGTPVRAYTSGNEAFAAKLDSNGDLLWSTFLGGTGSDTGFGNAIDDDGNVYVVGDSLATWGTPVRAYTAGTETFLVKLNGTDGTLTWSTFLGGSGSDNGRSVATDADGNVYVSGHSTATWGTPVRAYALLSDIYAVKLDTSGAIIWNTFLGGSAAETGSAIAVDSDGNVYVGGTGAATWGSPVRAYTLGTDASVAKLDSSGALIWNTFLGGSGTDTGQAIEADSSGNVYVSGNSAATWGTPVRDYTSGNDAYASKLDSSGALIWNTFLGGAGSDTGLAIELDSGGNVYVSGNSAATWGTPFMDYIAGTDAMAIKLDTSGAIIWNAFIGGSGTDTGTSLEVVGSDYVYISGGGSATWGTPVRAYTSGLDAYAAKFVNFVPANAPAPAPSSGGGTAHPIIHLTKEATPASLPDGSASVTYTYVMTNPGNVTLTDITLVDDKCSDVIYISGDSNGNSFLEPSETWVYTCTIILTKTTINFATAQGFGAGLVTSDTAIAEVFVGTPAPVPPTVPTSTEPTPPPVVYRDLRNALVKLPDDGDANTQTDSAVYYIGSDGKRHAFPNEKVYFTWYSNFNGIQVMDESQLSSIPLGKNVTYKPGVKMVKFMSDPKVYAVSRNGVLRWITSESLAISLYGSNWTQRIDDISDAFYTNYQFGMDIDSTSDYDPAAEEASVTYPGESL